MTNKILPLEDNAPKAVVVAGDSQCREALEKILATEGLSVVVVGDLPAIDIESAILAKFDERPQLVNLINEANQEELDKVVSQHKAFVNSMEIGLSLHGGHHDTKNLILYIEKQQREHDAMLYQIERERGCEGMKKPAFLLEQRKFKGKKARRQHR